ncbi:MAG TPA: hypothetical protein P5232_04180 [Candidatus Moranbacteria bacterium]|nr:hypothetical protein [Candidatus Moranbacteria bacterium]
MGVKENKKYRKKYPHKRREYRKRNYDRTLCNGWNEKKPWLPKEDKEIIRLGKPTDRILSAKFGRSVKAIQTRRYKLKRKAKK